jgi:hypothetical protein
VHLEGLYKEESSTRNEMFFVTFENSNDIVSCINSPTTNSPDGPLECKKADDIHRDVRMRVELRGVPLEIPDGIIEEALGGWFTVAEVHRLTFPKHKGVELKGLQDGRRLAYVTQVLGALPAAVRVYDKTFKIHFFAPPERQFCWQCWRQGHTKDECPNAPACRYCRSEQHGTRECPQNPGALARQQREAQRAMDAAEEREEERGEEPGAAGEGAMSSATLPPVMTSPEANEAAAEIERKLTEMRPAASAPATPNAAPGADTAPKAAPTPTLTPKRITYNLDVGQALIDLEKLKGTPPQAARAAGSLYSEKAASPPKTTGQGVLKRANTIGNMTVLGKSPPKITPKGRKASKPVQGRQPTPNPSLNIKNTPETQKQATPNQSSAKRNATPPKNEPKKKPPNISSAKLVNLSKITQFQC